LAQLGKSLNTIALLLPLIGQLIIKVTVVVHFGQFCKSGANFSGLTEHYLLGEKRKMNLIRCKELPQVHIH